MKIVDNLLIGFRREIRLQDIMILTADANYTRIHLSNGGEIIFAITLKEVEKRFAKTGAFFRTHKSFLINLAYVQKFDTSGSEMKVCLKDNFYASVSRRKKTAFIKKMNSQDLLSVCKADLDRSPISS